MTREISNNDIVLPNGVTKEKYKKWLELCGIGYLQEVFGWIEKNHNGDWALAESWLFACFKERSPQPDHDEQAWFWLWDNFMAKSQFKNFLDIGCNFGYLILSLARMHRNCQFQGLDASQALVGTAEGLTCKFDVGNANFIHGDALNMTMFKDKQFDIVFSKHVLEHLPSTFLALKEQLRVGKLVVGFAPLNEDTDNAQHIFTFSEKSLSEVLPQVFKHYDMKTFNDKIIAYAGWE